MARDFDGSSHVLRTADPIVSAYPFTAACWFFPDVSTGQMLLMSGTNNGASPSYWHCNLQPTNIVRAQIDSGDGLASITATTATFTDSAWNHAAVVFASTTSRSAYVNGGNKVTGTATEDFPATLTHTLIGAQQASSTPTYNSFFNGRIAEVAIWAAALDDAEVAALGAGMCPLLIRSASIVAYWPLHGRHSPETDPVGKFDMTVTGATAGAHSRIIYPARRNRFFVPAILSPPAAPSSLTAVATGTTIRLEWLDNSNNETGFRIYRRRTPV